MTFEDHRPADQTAGTSLNEKLSNLRRKSISHLLTGLGNAVIGYLLITHASDIAATLSFLPEWLVTGAGYVSAGVGVLYILLSVLSAVMLFVVRKKLAGLPQEVLEKANAGES
ncbi:hypothetical protein [Labrenzia sp. VG12]|uniref:hypothetical protein n=1 Tax=Labrenzia sp. VG12 TaxID=2021862 RepID=UPI000B8C2ABF|nr:hypothetical protein [Labrenzia sp. VG12]ASP31851.1 hypothetical protein CHH27_00200 [Labrenzia sp. VG12]